MYAAAATLKRVAKRAQIMPRVMRMRLKWRKVKGLVTGYSSCRRVLAFMITCDVSEGGNINSR